jgi:FlgD Ig-like domain
MKQSLLCLSLGLLSLAFLLPLAHSQPKCKKGNTKNTAYMLRDNDPRCEGIIDPDASGSEFNLSSLAVGQLQTGSKLSLAIPKIPNLPKPQVRINSIPPRYYQLDSLDLKDQGSQWQFTWQNDILRQENISLTSLRSIAQAGDVVVPVLFSKPNPPAAYDIRINTSSRAQKATLKILKNSDKPLYSATLLNQPSTEVRFSWNGKNQQGKSVPAGIYTLIVEALIERRNAPPETRRLTRQFAHNSAWLQ